MNPHDLALPTWLLPQPVIVVSDHRSAGCWSEKPIIDVADLDGVLVSLHIWSEPSWLFRRYEEFQVDVGCCILFWFGTRLMVTGAESEWSK